MKIYVVTLAVGMLVGAIYGLLGVRSPAPPLVALFGLLGILIGEQAYAVVHRAVRRDPITAAWIMGECAPKITGVPPAPSSVEKPPDVHPATTDVSSDRREVPR